MSNNIWDRWRRLDSRLFLKVRIGFVFAMGFVPASLLMGQQATRGGLLYEPWMDAPPTSTGLAIGQKIPPYELRDQSGHMQDFNSIRGPNGAAIYFLRSA